MRNLLTTILFLSVLVTHSASACNLQCRNAELFNENEAADKKLNIEYRKLTAKLNRATLNDLRTIQRQWIETRDRICEEKEEHWCAESGCTNILQTLSAGNEALKCSLLLTNIRIQELITALNAVKAGEPPSLTFQIPQ